MSEDLVAFLRARLDEDERISTQAQPGDWIAGRTTEPDWGPVGAGTVGEQVFAEGEWWPKTQVVEGTHVAVNGPGGGMIARMDRTRYRTANVGHVLNWKPARVLAEVAAKRAILQTYDEAREFYDRHQRAPAGELHGLHQAIEFLAQPYADHPDFDPAWKLNPT